MTAIFLIMVCIAIPGVYIHFFRNAYKMNKKENVREYAQMLARRGQFGLAEKYMEEHFFG